MQPHSSRFCDALLHWANEAPDRILVARRDQNGDWHEVTYQQMLEKVRHLASHLITRDLSAERPVVILSGNSIEHLTVALATAWIGLPHAPISPPYSLLSTDFSKLRHAIETLTPGLIFVDHIERFARAIEAVVPATTEVLALAGDLPQHTVASYTDWTNTQADPSQARAVEQAFEQVTGDTILKFMFTSGSTKLPKAVITTHGMVCANQQMIRQSLKFLANEAPVLVDWLPWNHVFGGNHNVGIVLSNGGSLYIDDGNPSPAGMQTTLKNLREISPTIYFNVPKGFEEIARAMSTDEVLAKSLLARIKCFFFAGAGLAQAVWDQLDQIAESTVGERISIITGLGMTETAPSSTFAVRPGLRAGQIGLPCPGVEAKLTPVEGKVEIRFRGPHVTAGYWRSPEQTKQAFDEEGYYRTGDAVTWADEEDQQQGLMFDGRTAEDFKLSTGTFVSVGPLRAKAIAAGSPLIQDVVLTGINRDQVGILVFMRQDECASLAGLSGPDAANLKRVLSSAPVIAWVRQLLERLGKQSTGSANRITRAMLLEDPPSLDLGEITDKGSINQRAVLKHRAALIEALYDDQTSDPLIVISKRS